MQMPDDLRKRLNEFEKSLPNAWSNAALAVEFRRIFEEVEMAFSAIGLKKIPPPTESDFLQVDSTTRWP